MSHMFQRHLSVLKQMLPKPSVNTCHGPGTTHAHGESWIDGITPNAWWCVVPVFSGGFCGGTYETHSCFNVSTSPPSAALRSVKLDFLCSISHTFRSPRAAYISARTCAHRSPKDTCVHHLLLQRVSWFARNPVRVFQDFLSAM